jgi:hypothetical protein
VALHVPRSRPLRASGITSARDDGARAVETDERSDVREKLAALVADALERAYDEKAIIEGESTLPLTRELSLVITALEQAGLWLQLEHGEQHMHRSLLDALRGI